MADYKDMLGKLAGKVKDAAGPGGVTGVYAKGAERAKAFGQAAKLTLDNNRDFDELKRVYAEIGKLYYEQAKGSPEGFFVPLFEQAGKLTEGIRERQREIDALKAQTLGTEQSAADAGLSDFDAIVSQAEREAREE